MALSPKQQEYQTFYKGKLAKWKVKSPMALSDADKKKFFNEIEKEWTKDDDNVKGLLAALEAKKEQYDMFFEAMSNEIPDITAMSGDDHDIFMASIQVGWEALVEDGIDGSEADHIMTLHAISVQGNACTRECTDEHGHCKYCSEVFKRYPYEVEDSWETARLDMKVIDTKNQYLDLSGSDIKAVVQEAIQETIEGALGPIEKPFLKWIDNPGDKKAAISLAKGAKALSSSASIFSMAEKILKSKDKLRALAASNLILNLADELKKEIGKESKILSKRIKSVGAAVEKEANK